MTTPTQSLPSPATLGATHIQHRAPQPTTKPSGRPQRETCDVCGTDFVPRLRYQMREENGHFVRVCSLACQSQKMARTTATCSVCKTDFTPQLAFQVVAHDSGREYLCSLDCRSQWRPSRNGALRRIAVFNHKGGTGKTTTSVNLAAAMAESGARVLLVDADGQGNVGASLGIRGERSLYDVLVHGAKLEDCVVTVRQNLDVLTSNATLAAAELHLAQKTQRARVLKERLASQTEDYDLVVLDCAPALSLMNQNALTFAQGVLVPVACDYLSLVGVRQVLSTIAEVKRTLRHEVELLGVLPTFYDVRNKISKDALETLQKSFKEKCLPPVRVNVRLREAPRSRQTIFELAPDSNGAKDYLKLGELIREALDPKRMQEVA